MGTPVLVLIVAVTAMGFIYVVWPFARGVYRRFRYQKVVTCPDTRGLAEVRLNARWAGVTAVFGDPHLRVKHCSLWPRKKDCAQRCVKENWPTE